MRGSCELIKKNTHLIISEVGKEIKTTILG